MQCTDVTRMDPLLAVGVVMISTYPTTLETTETPTPDAVVRTRHPQGTQLVTVAFFTGGSHFYSTDVEVFYEAGNQEKYTFSRINTSQKVVLLEYG